MNDIDERFAELERQLLRLRAVHEVQNLMGRYTVNHTPGTIPRAIHLFALDRPDVSVEIGDRGVYFGEAGLRELFQDRFVMETEGNLLIHYLATPMIEVARDGQSARGVWRSPGIEAVRQSAAADPIALWSFGAYAVDFAYSHGEWKILHLRWFRTIKCSFAQGWVEDLSMANSGPISASSNVGPTTYHNPYTPRSVQEPLPPCPPAYETYDGPGWALMSPELP